MTSFSTAQIYGFLQDKKKSFVIFNQIIHSPLLWRKRPVLEALASFVDKVYVYISLFSFVLLLHDIIHPSLKILAFG